MAQFHFVNVNDAFYGLVQYIQDYRDGVYADDNPQMLTETESRNGPVVAFTEPVMIQYSSPTQRVLFDKARDCNPFFHLYESIHMLAGSNLIKPLAYFASNMLNYSDDGVTQNGAYGHRWRHAKYGRLLSDDICPEGQLNCQVDQLDMLIDHLRTTPNSRRAVLQMWDVENDLLKVGRGYCDRCFGGPCDDTCPNKETVKGSLDVCCNTEVMFSIRKANQSEGEVAEQGEYSYLDMTVINRSNDLILGCLGANQCHFGYLLQYMADCLGLWVGVYNQISNNLHVYLNNWKPKEWLQDNEHSECYPKLTKLPLVKDKQQFDEECKLIVDNVIRDHTSTSAVSEPYLNQVVVPMIRAFNCHKAKTYSQAYRWMEDVQAPDWRKAGTEWLQRREANWLAKQGSTLNQ